MSLDLKMFRRAMYPNCEESGEIFDLDLNRCVKWSGKNICYLAYYLRDDCYDTQCFENLEVLSKYVYTTPLFIFKITCPENIFKNLDDVGYEKLDHLLNMGKSQITGDSYASDDLLTIDNFPNKIPTDHKLTKHEFLEPYGISYGHKQYKRNEYINICSRFETGFFKYPIEDVLENTDYYVRIIKIIESKGHKYILEINSLAISYDYENYIVWNYYIPNSKIPKQVGSNMLLQRFFQSINT